MILGACTWSTAALAMSDELGTLEERPLVVYLADQLIYSDNLFRLSEAQPIADEFVAQGAEREDYANRISAGLRAKVDNSRQSFALDLRGSDVQFRHADYLDHTAGHADLQWRWQFGNAWSGKITGEYDHALASLANYRYFGRDIVDTYAYSGELEYRIGARWALSAGGRAARTTHSAEDRRLNDFESEAATLTLAYITPSENRLALEYRYTAAKFPREALATSLTSPQYDESIARLRLHYAFSRKTSLEASAGYLRRDSESLRSIEFSGTIGRVSLEWQPREQFGLSISAWHELRAYVDAESDYFLSDGFAAGPIWKPLRKLSVRLLYSYEDQDYVGNPALASSDAERRDRVRSARAIVSYHPVRNLLLNLSWVRESRSSNRELQGFEAELAGAEVRLLF